MSAAPNPVDPRGPELPHLLRLALPLVGANLLQMAVYAVDVIFVARLGPGALAAATLGVYFYSVIMFALFGLTGAASPVIAAELGRRRHAVREVRRSVRMAMWLGVLAALPFMVLMAFGGPLLRLMGQDPATAQAADGFLDILLWALLPAVISGVLRQTVSALGRAGWATFVTALALGMNILGNWALVFGHLGLPALGLSGSAIASVVTTLTMMAAYAVIVAGDRRIRRYRLFGRWWRPEWPRLIELVRLGVPIAVTMTFEGALFSAAAFLVGLIGVTEVAAHAVALQIAAIAFQVPFGISQAATIRVGLFFGAGDAAGVARAGRTALLVGIGFMGITAALLWAMPRLFVSAYVDVDAPGNARMVALAIEYLGVAAMFQLVDGAQVVAAGCLRGLKDTRVPMVIAGLGYWIAGFGSSVALGFGVGLEGFGVWLGLALGLLAVSVLLLWRWAIRERLGLVPGVS